MTQDSYVSNGAGTQSADLVPTRGAPGSALTARARDARDRAAGKAREKVEDARSTVFIYNMQARQKIEEGRTVASLFAMQARQKAVVATTRYDDRAGGAVGTARGAVVKASSSTARAARAHPDRAAAVGGVAVLALLLRRLRR